MCVCVVYKMYIIQNKTKKIIFLKGDPKKIQNFQSFQDFLPDYINPSMVLIIISRFFRAGRFIKNDCNFNQSAQKMIAGGMNSVNCDTTRAHQEAN